MRYKGKANNEDPDHLVLVLPIQSKSTLFMQNLMSQNIGLLWSYKNHNKYTCTHLVSAKTQTSHDFPNIIFLPP